MAQLEAENLPPVRPVCSYKISRVCHGYSEHLHAAIGLFETLADKIASWSITHKPSDESCCVEIFTRDFKSHIRKGQRPSLVIAECVLELLNANQVNDKVSDGCRQRAHDGTQNV